jgi:hypothetical protein
MMMNKDAIKAGNQWHNRGQKCQHSIRVNEMKRDIGEKRIALELLQEANDALVKTSVVRKECKF